MRKCFIIIYLNEWYKVISKCDAWVRIILWLKSLFACEVFINCCTIVLQMHFLWNDCGQMSEILQKVMLNSESRWGDSSWHLGAQSTKRDMNYNDFSKDWLFRVHMFLFVFGRVRALNSGTWHNSVCSKGATYTYYLKFGCSVVV